MSINNRKLQKNGSWGKNPVKFHSLKNNTICWAESILEKDAFLKAEFENIISRYSSQPMSFVQRINGKERRYTPDLQIKSITGEHTFIEVKPDNKAEEESFLENFKYWQWYIKRKWKADLIIWKESEIRVGDTIKNYEYLYHLLRYSNKNNLPSRKKIILNMGREFLFSDLKEFVNKRGYSDTAAFECVAWNMFDFDVTKKLQISTHLEVR